MIKPLSKSEIKELNRKIKEQYGIDDLFHKKDKIVLKKENNEKSILKDNKETFFYSGEDLVPNLHLLQENNFLKKITVDMGAIKFVTNGADVMRPGITKIDETIRKGDIVVVVDEKNNKPLAVCKALLDVEEMKTMKEGKALENLHYVGDKRWKNS